MFRMYRRAAARKAGCVAVAVVMAMSMLAGLTPVAAGAATTSANLPPSTDLNGVYYWLGKDQYNGNAYYDQGAMQDMQAAVDYLTNPATYATVTNTIYGELLSNDSGLFNPNVETAMKNTGVTGLQIAQLYQDAAALSLATGVSPYDVGTIAGKIDIASDNNTLESLINYSVFDYYYYLLDIQGIGIPYEELNSSTNSSAASEIGQIFQGNYSQDVSWLAAGMRWVGLNPSAVTGYGGNITTVDGPVYTALSQLWTNQEMAQAQVDANTVDTNIGSKVEVDVMKAYIRSRAHFTYATQIAGGAGEETFSVLENGKDQGQIEIVLPTGDITLTGVLPYWTGGTDVTPTESGSGSSATLSVAGGTTTASNVEITGYAADPTVSGNSDTWIYKGAVSVTTTTTGGPGGPTTTTPTAPAVAALTANATLPPGSIVWPYKLIKYGEESFDFNNGVNYQFTTTQGTPPYTWSMGQGPGSPGTFTWSAVPGSLPSGLTLSSSGLLSGTPKTLQSIGYFLLPVTVTDSTGTKYSMNAKLFVAAFPDIIDDWAVNDIDQLTVAGVVYGYPDHMFWPKNDITRGEFAQWLVLSHGIKPMTDFSDLYQFEDYGQIPNWDKPYLAAAVANGLMFGYGQDVPGQYVIAADKTITREEMGAMIGRWIKNVAPLDLDTKFVEGNQVHNWEHNFREDVAIAAAAGIIKGFPDDHLNPLQFTLRDQAAAMVARWMGIADPNE